jgi:hypothetical protein
MSKRLQVLLDESELNELKRIARRNRVSVAAWVRQVLRIAASESPTDPREKLAAIERAAGYNFPTADIDQVLAEIERGYAG